MKQLVSYRLSAVTIIISCNLIFYANVVTAKVNITTRIEVTGGQAEVRQKSNNSSLNITILDDAKTMIKTRSSEDGLEFTINSSREQEEENLVVDNDGKELEKPEQKQGSIELSTSATKYKVNVSEPEEGGKKTVHTYSGEGQFDKIFSFAKKILIFGLLGLSLNW